MKAYRPEQIQIAKRALRLLNAGRDVTPRYANLLLNILDSTNHIAASEMPTWFDEDLREGREEIRGRMRRRVWVA